MFLTFSKKKELSERIDSEYIEFQYCRLKKDTKLSEITEGEVSFGLTDSLYIAEDDLKEFFEQYSDILNFGYYGNQQTGVVDPYGINYYKADSVDIIIKKLTENKPSDYKLFKEWLEEAKKYNGFYILGY